MPDPDNAAGTGGKARESSVMSQVDAAVKGGPAHPAATPSTPATSGEKVHPAASSYAPNPDMAKDGKPRVYGSPISTPVLSGGNP